MKKQKTQNKIISLGRCGMDKPTINKQFILPFSTLPPLFGVASKVDQNDSYNNMIQNSYYTIDKIINHKPFVEGVTQLECEKALVDCVGTWIDKYDKNKNIDGYAMGSRATSEWFYDKRLSIIRSINNLKKIREYEEPLNEDTLNKLTTKLKSKAGDKFNKKLLKFRLAYILSNNTHDKLANYLLNTFITVLYQKDNPDKVVSTDISITLGRSVFRLTHRKIYDSYVKQCQKEGKDVLSYSEWKNNTDSLLEQMFDVSQVNIDTYTSACGRILIEQLIEHDMLYEYLNPNNKAHTLGINSDTLSVIERDIDNIIPLPIHLPMLEVPKKYSFTDIGGYLLNGVDYIEPLIIQNKHLQSTSVIKKVSLFDMVNGVSATPFCINKDLLEFIDLYGKRFSLFLSKSKINIESKEFKVMKKVNKSAYKDYISNQDKYNLENNILIIARLYSKYDKIYFPARLDTRGRLYCTPLYLNYQGTELAKSLLLFSDKVKLYLDDTNSIEYFHAYGANCYGNGVDKYSRRKKVQWVKDNHDNIINLDNGILLMQAKNKYLFIAFALEYIRIQNVIDNERVSFVYTQLPIQLDATCNGYQHLAMLSRDNDLGKNLNLMSSTKDDVPNDFYGLLLNKITQKLQESYECGRGDGNEEAYRRILEFKPGRSLIKKPIMIESYNAGLVKSSDSLKEGCYCINEPDFNGMEYDKDVWSSLYKQRRYVLSENSNPDVYLLNDDFNIIIKVMKDVLKNDYPKLTKLRLYLSDIAKVCNKLNVFIPWTLPSGLHIRQSYLTDTTFQIKAFEYNKKSYTITHINEDLDKRKQVRALMPNLIHSLDAASLVLLYNKYTYTNKSIYTVHDCFAVPIPNVEVLIELLQSVYLEIYSDQEYIKKFDSLVLSTILDTYRNDIIFIDNDKNLKKPKQLIYNKTKIDYPNVDLLFEDVSDFNLIFDALKNKKAIYAII